MEWEIANDNWNSTPSNETCRLGILRAYTDRGAGAEKLAVAG